MRPKVSIVVQLMHVLPMSHPTLGCMPPQFHCYDWPSRSFSYMIPSMMAACCTCLSSINACHVPSELAFADLSPLGLLAYNFIDEGYMKDFIFVQAITKQSRFKILEPHGAYGVMVNLAWHTALESSWARCLRKVPAYLLQKPYQCSRVIARLVWSPAHHGKWPCRLATWC